VTTAPIVPARLLKIDLKIKEKKQTNILDNTNPPANM
jgi:hypothetical protein